MIERRLDDPEASDVLWPCKTEKPCVICEKPTGSSRTTTCCVLCVGSYHNQCLRIVGVHSCPAHHDYPLTDAELASNETLACRAVEHARFENIEAVRLLRKLPA